MLAFPMGFRFNHGSDYVCDFEDVAAVCEVIDKDEKLRETDTHTFSLFDSDFVCIRAIVVNARTRDVGLRITPADECKLRDLIAKLNEGELEPPRPETPSTESLEDLPNEVLERICQFLPPEDVIHCQQASRRIYNLIREHLDRMPKFYDITAKVESVQEVLNFRTHPILRVTLFLEQRRLVFNVVGHTAFPADKLYQDFYPELQDTFIGKSELLKTKERDPHKFFTWYIATLLDHQVVAVSIFKKLLPYITIKCVELIGLDAAVAAFFIDNLPEINHLRFDSGNYTETQLVDLVQGTTATALTIWEPPIQQLTAEFFAKDFIQRLNHFVLSRSHLNVSVDDDTLLEKTKHIAYFHMHNAPRDLSLDSVRGVIEQWRKGERVIDFFSIPISIQAAQNLQQVYASLHTCFEECDPANNRHSLVNADFTALLDIYVDADSSFFNNHGGFWHHGVPLEIKLKSHKRAPVTYDV